MDADVVFSMFRKIAAVAILTALAVGVLLGAIVAFSVAGRF